MKIDIWPTSPLITSLLINHIKCIWKDGIANMDAVGVIAAKIFEENDFVMYILIIS